MKASVLQRGVRARLSGVRLTYDPVPLPIFWLFDFDRFASLFGCTVWRKQS
jgi:hypothetical protein